MRPVIVALSCLALLAAPAAAVTLQASSATVARSGDSGEVCVALVAGGDEVAGTQNDLIWDGACATLADAGRCYAAGTHGKSLQGKLLDNRGFAYRGLVLSLSDVDPIADGVLYCCAFTVEADPGTCCDVRVTGAAASDPRGNALGALGAGGALCVAGGDEPIVATPTPTPTPSFMHTFSCIFCVVPEPDDGCQTGAPQAGSAWPLAIVTALYLLRRRVR